MPDRLRKKGTKKSRIITEENKKDRIGIFGEEQDEKDLDQRYHRKRRLAAAASAGAGQS